MAALGLVLVAPQVSAQNQPPVCEAGGPYLVQDGEAIQFDGTGSSDPDGTVVSYVWLFGDGASASGPQPVHTYGTAGIFTVTLRITDNGGASSSCNAEVDVERIVPDVPGGSTLDDYIAQVEVELPPLDPGMVDVDPGPDWFADVTVEGVAAAVGDDPPNTILFEGDMWIAFDEPESLSTRFVRLDYSRDYMRYINQEREFDYNAFPHRVVSELEALNVLWDVVGALNLPNPEMGSPQVDTVMEMGFDTASGAEDDLEVERLVTLPRMINDYPVFGSRARIAVSNLGDPARVQIKWRQFRLVPDLETSVRDEVVRAIAERIWDAERGTDVEVDIELGYGWTPAGYAPVARVGVTDLEGMLEGGMTEMVPVAASTTIGVSPTPAPAPVMAMSVRYSYATDRATIEFDLPAAQRARVAVYDATGRAVRQLADRRHLAGHHEILWDGRDQRGRLLASGVYFVRLSATSGELVQKIAIVR
ncbi:MAG: PKD domain-containing protein [Candidatus Eiseniibacteriota bacterium]